MAPQDKWPRLTPVQRGILQALTAGDRIIGDGEAYWLAGSRRQVALSTLRSLVRDNLIFDPRTPLFEREAGRPSKRGKLWRQAAGGDHG